MGLEFGYILKGATTEPPTMLINLKIMWNGQPLEKYKLSKLTKWDIENMSSLEKKLNPYLIFFKEKLQAQVSPLVNTVKCS